MGTGTRPQAVIKSQQPTYGGQKMSSLSGPTLKKTKNCFKLVSKIAPQKSILSGWVNDKILVKIKIPK